MQPHGSLMLRLALSLLATAAVIGGCNSIDSRIEGGIEVHRSNAGIGDFSAPTAAVRAQARTLALDPTVYAPPVIEVEATTIVAAGPETHASESTATEQVISKSPDGEEHRELIARTQSEEVAVNRPWPIEGLVGQINGRPLFADRFFAPLQARIVQMAASPDRVEARRAIIDLIRFSFKEYVDSELIIAEAESGLSTDQQQGLFAWLASLEEVEIAERGGSLLEAEASLMDERGMSIEEFLQERRDVALAQQLLRKRIEPRAIVSWRDIERAFRRRESEINPPPAMLIGRMRFDTTTDGAKIEQVKQLIGEGKTLPEIADALGVPNHGAWNEFKLPPEGIRGLPLTDAVKDRLIDLPVGKPSAVLEQKDSMTWLAVLGISQAPYRSVFDPSVQTHLREDLRIQRVMAERDRWLRSLRSRWVSEGIEQMEARLVQIAMTRYWQ